MLDGDTSINEPLVLHKALHSRLGPSYESVSHLIIELISELANIGENKEYLEHARELGLPIDTTVFASPSHQLDFAGFLCAICIIKTEDQELERHRVVLWLISWISLWFAPCLPYKTSYERLTDLIDNALLLYKNCPDLDDFEAEFSCHLASIWQGRQDNKDPETLSLSHAIAFIAGKWAGHYSEIRASFF
jgi:hypothetical protein